MEKSALTNITEKLTQSEKIFVSDLKLLAGEARRQAYRLVDRAVAAALAARRVLKMIPVQVFRQMVRSRPGWLRNRSAAMVQMAVRRRRTMQAQ